MLLPWLLLGTVLLWPAQIDDDQEATRDADSAKEVSTWTQWRGPHRDGRYEGPIWPDGLGEDRLKLIWSTELGEGYATPIVSSDRVFTVETRNEKQEVVRAFDRESGKEVWQRAWDGAMTVPFFAARNGSWVRATPALSQGRLFVAGMRDVLVCLDARTGEEIWRVDFVDRYGTELPAFGFASSPLVTEDAVYVQAGASFCKLDPATGAETWRTMVDEGGMNGSAFASPVLLEIDGAPQLVVQARTHLQGVSPAGEALWRIQTPAFRGMNILTPVVFDDSLFTAAYGARARLLRIARLEGGWNVTAEWEAPLQGYMTSPVVVDEHAYLFTRSNRFSCIHLPSGEVRWTSPPTGDSYWSLILQGDRILALSDRGRLSLIHADPTKLEIIGEAIVSDQETWGHLAMSRGQLFVRELRGLRVFDWE